MSNSSTNTDSFFVPGQARGMYLPGTVKCRICGQEFPDVNLLVNPDQLLAREVHVLRHRMQQ